MSIVGLGGLLTWLLWQPVMLDPKPNWYAFNVPEVVNYLLFVGPFAVVFYLNRGQRGLGWLQGGLMLAVGYILTLPYNAIVENAKFASAEGFVKYHGGSWPYAIGEIITIAVAFFALGALVGYFAGKSGPARSVPAPGSHDEAVAGAPPERVSQEGVSGPGAQ